MSEKVAPVAMASGNRSAPTASGATTSPGTIDLIVGGAVNDTFDISAMGVTNMVPGITEAQTITVNNFGTAPFKYTVTSGTAPATTWAGSEFGGSGNTTTGGLITTGRQLAAGVTETPCFEVKLPTDAGSGLQGKTTTATLTFTATSDLS